MGLLQERYKKYREPQKFMEAGVYPYFREITGKQGTENYSSLLKKFRETFLNIDMQVINQFSDLFMNLW